MSHLTYADVMSATCNCCNIRFYPSAPYSKNRTADSYASVVQQNSALSMHRQMTRIEAMPHTCTRTREMYLYMQNVRAYLQTKSFLWPFRKLHLTACVKLTEFVTQLEHLKHAAVNYCCTCKLASLTTCNDQYISLFKRLLQEYRNGAGFQQELFNLLSARMSQDVAAEVMSYMFSRHQFNMTQLYQRGNCL